MRSDLTDADSKADLWSAPGLLPALLDDLRVLGHTSAGDDDDDGDLVHDEGRSLPIFAGLSYVAEGSLLGGRQIMKRWGAELGLTPQRGGRFLNSSSGHPHRWKEFCIWLEGLDFTPAEEELAAEAANGAFAGLDNRLRYAGENGRTAAAAGAGKARAEQECARP